MVIRMDNNRQVVRRRIPPSPRAWKHLFFLLVLLLLTGLWEQYPQLLPLLGRVNKSPGRSDTTGPMTTFDPSLLASFDWRDGATVCGGLSFSRVTQDRDVDDKPGFGCSCRENARCGNIKSHYTVINRLRGRSYYFQASPGSAVAFLQARF
ncbi:hypothetical protein MAPG_09040 [Magnaporthiopsis poae ATCC 64411]|uniref:Uncharacterized protein n=1 Tax=Magnaporthiopsis poae (strain ATCC 64411 / 73-15) TaxID=644358 RepID=A0A0C4E8X0_MAGP6|nr:hypothetical protein MAPG_09040 [Magnaporthiopsis poae ATCC 64411]